MNLLPKFTPQKTDDQLRSELESQLLRMEAKIGGELFGPLAEGHSRQFFCFDQYTWIWSETWNDQTGKQHTITTRYLVRQGGILKSQDGQTYQPLSHQEADHLDQAMELYRQRVSAEYQRMLAA